MPFGDTFGFDAGRGRLQYDMGGYNAEPMMYEDPMASAVPIMDTYQPAVAPMTQEAVAPYDFSGFDFSGLDLSGLGGFGGGRMGGVIQDPNIQYITAPLSNKGNPTSRMGGSGNTFAVRADQPVRLVDLRTNQIVFEGTGFDAARKATELGQNLSNTLGRKATYDIQTADPSGVYTTVAHEKKNKSTLGKIGSVVGTALPIAVSLIPGLQVLGPIASSIAAGGAGAAMAGRDPLKGAIMGGLSAAGGQYLGSALRGADVGAKAATAIGTGLGSTAGGLVTGQSLKNSLLGGVASGGLSYLGGELQGALRGSPSAGGGGGDTNALPGDIVVSGYGTPSIAAPADFAAKKAPEATSDGQELVVTGNRLPFVAPTNNLFNNVQYEGGENVRDATPEPKADEFKPGEEIIVSGYGTPSVASPFAVNAQTPAADYAVKPAEQPADNIDPEEDILVTATRTPSIGVPAGALEIGSTGFTIPENLLNQVNAEAKKELEAGDDKTKLSDIADYLRLGSAGIGLLGSLFGGGGGGSSGVRYPGGGTGTLNPLFSAKLPAPNLPGATGNFAVRPQSDFGVTNGQPRDWTKYGFGPEASFFNYVPQPGSAPVAAPITTPIPNEPSAPAMYAPDVDNMRFAKGGPSKRTTFAVNGPGDGRSDEIPAMLSDGEYVMDAETVALLGNGSFKGGAKALDQFRVNLRKHKGQKLAKGKFSVNAKRPERYLVGGRI
jgi:hypothetical protein